LTNSTLNKTGEIIDPLTILAALGPLAVDLGKSLIGRFIQTDVYKPVNIGEYVQMRGIDLEMFKAMNNVGASGQTTYPWVEAVVRLMRPGVAVVVLGTWGFMQMSGQDSASVNNFASAVGFWLFGDRTLFYAQKK
jgi:hypothetical protein